MTTEQYTKEVKKLFNEAIVDQDIKKADLIEASGLKKPTFYKQWNNPKLMRVETVIRICDYLNISKEKRSTIIWG